MSRKPNHRRSSATPILIVLIILMIAATALVVWMCIDLVNKTPTTSKPESTVQLPDSGTTPSQAPAETQAPTTAPAPEPETVVATASIATMGDLLMHKPIIDTCATGDGYNFDSIFKYLKDYTSAYDYAAANLETTLGGPDYPIQGNPHFNCPDSIVDSVVNAGYDMLLTANNHCGDTTASGILRTLEQVRGKGLKTLGTMLNDEEKKYEVVDVNGIKIGMLCYTYATGVTSDGRPQLNGNAALSQAGIVNYFMETNLDKFYSEVEQHLADMKADGAEATMVFLHWGVEYQLQENNTQRTMAQKLCDMGVDVIVGGHPHVVEPVDLLQSSVDPDHKTVIIYSLGNAVSNQRLGNISYVSTAHTEDGALFSVTFEKYSDGKVYLAGADVLPTWVNMHSNNGSKEYNILPLDISKEDQWTEMFNLTANNFSSAQASYKRTMDIVGEGLQECQDYLAQAKTDREAYYLDLAMNPEKYATEPSSLSVVETTETQSQTVETTLPAAA